MTKMSAEFATLHSLLFLLFGAPSKFTDGYFDNIFEQKIKLHTMNAKRRIISSTLISLINVEAHLLIFKRNPPSSFIDFLNFFHPPCLFQPPRLLHYVYNP